jgi:hypothetical protein
VEWASIYPSFWSREEGASGTGQRQARNSNQDYSLSANNVMYFFASEKAKFFRRVSLGEIILI